MRWNSQVSRMVKTVSGSQDSRRITRIFLVCISALALALPAPAAEAVKKSTEKFTVGDKSIEVEVFTPSTPGPHPVVVMLPGSEGLEQCGPAFRLGAQLLANEGYVTLLVHYFDRTGTKQIKPEAITKQLFDAWAETVRAALAYAAKRPNVDKEHIGVIGFSLGACLALSVTGQGDRPVTAVVDWFGKLPVELHGQVKRLPPTLIIHGGADKTVPVAEAHALAELLKSKKLPYEIRIYEKQEHLFQTEPFGKDACDARKQTLGFLAKHLKPEAGLIASARARNGSKTIESPR